MTRLFEAKPFIIAEVGSNWQTFEDCIRSIDVAKDCGADAVKFQAFSHEALYGWEWPERDQGGNRPRMNHELELTWIPTLAKGAKKVGIEFMCTAFSPELVAAVDPYVEVHKIASSDCCWPQMLDAIKATVKPALFSTGGKTPTEVDAVENILIDGSKYVSMYCVAAYPADFVDFSEMETFEGFSDHTLGYTAAVEAARRGMTVIEKHFTAFPDLDTPDRPHSLTPKQFSMMVAYIRGLRKGSDQAPGEAAMTLRHNRRLIATRDIRQGETLRYGENFGSYRSLEDDLHGLSPFQWETVEGKIATRDIQRGKGVGLGDFE